MKRYVVIFILSGSLSCAQCQVSFAQGPSSFPAVDQATQQFRDRDRRHILETELQAEFQKLAETQATLTADPTQERAANVRRHLENIKALQRELRGTTGRQRVARESMQAVVRTARSTAPTSRSTNGVPAYWNPYNRAPDPESTH